jgi:Tol biopolymer transport system component
VLDRDEIAFRAVPAQSGSSRELFRWKMPQAGLSYDVAPQGERMLVYWPGPSPAGHAGKAFVVELPSGGNRRELPFSSPANVVWWRWLPDGKGWLLVRIMVPHITEVLRVDASGASSVLWKSTSQRLGEPTLSSDGRRVAFVSFSTESNAWVLRF